MVDSMCNYPAMMREDCFPEVIHHFWLVQFFSLLFHMDLLALGEESRISMHIDVPFRDENSTVIYSLYIDQLWVFVLLTIYCRRQFL